jgi:hypothetical protein
MVSSLSICNFTCSIPGNSFCGPEIGVGALCTCFFLFWVRPFAFFQPENFDFHTHKRFFAENMTLMSHIFIKKLQISTTSSSR